MTAPDQSRTPLDLGRPRDLGALITDGFGVYFRNFATFVAIAAAVVVPVQLLVAGVGLGQLTASYDATPDAAQQLIPFVAAAFVIAPLVTAMCIYALLDLADGKQPRIGATIQRGLDVFAPLLVAMLLYAAAVATGLFLLIIPGIYLLVRFIFVIPAVVVDGRRRADALRRSWDLTAGTWWRVAGIALASNILVGGLSTVVGMPFLAAASATDEAVFQLAGTMLGGVLFTAPAALIASLLYFDVRTRKGL